MTTTLVSFFNTTNIGDRLISKSLYEKLLRYDSINPIDYSGNNNIDLDFNISSKSSTLQKSYIKEIIKKAIKLMGLENFILKKYYKDRKNHNELFEKSIDESDILILGGGNMVFELSSNTNWTSRFKYYVEYAKSKKVPIFAMSIGIGPFHTEFQYNTAIEALKKCDYITFRDYKSYNLFKKSAINFENAHVVPDPVFSLPKFNEDMTRNDSIGLNIINPDIIGEKQNSSQIVEGYVELINELTDKFSKKIYIFNTEERDFTTCKRVYEKVNNKELVHLYQVNNLDDLFHIYGNLEVLIGTRMHSLITAYSQNIPIVGLYWQQKVEGMFELIEQKNDLFNLTHLSKHITEIVTLTHEKIHENTVKEDSIIRKKLSDMEKINDGILNTIYN